MLKRMNSTVVNIERYKSVSNKSLKAFTIITDSYLPTDRLFFSGVSKVMVTSLYLVTESRQCLYKLLWKIPIVICKNIVKNVLLYL